MLAIREVVTSFPQLASHYTLTAMTKEDTPHRCPTWLISKESQVKKLRQVISPSHMDKCLTTVVRILHDPKNFSEFVHAHTSTAHAMNRPVASDSLPPTRAKHLYLPCSHCTSHQSLPLKYTNTLFSLQQPPAVSSVRPYHRSVLLHSLNHIPHLPSRQWI